MPKQSLTRGTAILLAGNLFNRIIGFLFRVYLIRTIGTEGIGLYQRVISVFFTLLIVTTAGFPVAVPIMVAAARAREDGRAVHRITRLAFSLIIISGLLGALLLSGRAGFLAHRVLRDPRAYPALAVVAPALLFCAGTAILRGYFQGLQQMTPIAGSQVTEEIVQVAITFYLLRRLPVRDVPGAAVCLAAGLVVSEIAGFIFIALAYLRSRRSGHRPPVATGQVPNPGPGAAGVLREMVRLAVPVTFLRLILSLLSTLNAILIPTRLQAAGETLSSATALYGQLSGIAVTLVFLPTVFTQALSANLVPAVAEATARGQKANLSSQIRKALQLTYMLGLPVAALLIRFAEPLTAALFRAPEAARPLTVLAGGAIFIYFQQVSSGILNGLGKTSLPLRNIAIANAFTLPVLYYVTAIPGVGILGAAAAMAAGSFIACLLNFASLSRVTGYLFDPGHLLKTMAAASLTVVTTGQIYGMVVATAGGLPALALALSAGAVVYGAAMVGLGAFRVG